MQSFNSAPFLLIPKFEYNLCTILPIEIRTNVPYNRIYKEYLFLSMNFCHLQSHFGCLTQKRAENSAATSPLFKFRSVWSNGQTDKNISGERLNAMIITDPRQAAESQWNANQSKRYAERARQSSTAVLPNFEKLTAFLNSFPNPGKILHCITGGCAKPSADRINNRH